MSNKPYSESCDQNKRPILSVLQKWFTKPDALVFEIGSGTGQHACYFSEQLPHLKWQPSEQSIYIPHVLAWTEEAIADSSRIQNILPVIELDVAQQHWPELSVDYVFSANTMHIMSWPEVESMVKGIRYILKPGGIFCVYGPFNYQNQYTSDSNAQFDQWLKSRDPQSGIRDFEAICHLGYIQAEGNTLSLIHDHEMPANNRLLVFQSAE